MKILNNLKVKFKRFMTGKSGFSLVELIVVIAIMAVMAAVLAPALLGYVEKSRAQKDYSAMGEVVESATLALSTQNVYDEVLDHSVYDNVSCYVDNNCENLKTYHGSNDADYDFSNYYIPPKVTSLRALFKQCIKIKSGPKIPEGITDTASMFYNCKELLSAPSVPENVKNIEEMFLECNKLTSVTINCNPTTWTKALYSSKITTVNGNTTMKNDILLTKTSYAQNPTA